MEHSLDDGYVLISCLAGKTVNTMKGLFLSEYFLQKKKEITAQLGIEPRSLALCLEPAGTYTARIIPLDHCACLCY